MKARSSIRWRIQIWQTCLLAIIVICLGLLWYQKEKERAYNDVDHDLRDRSITMLRQLPHVVIRHSNDPEILEEFQRRLNRRNRGRHQAGSPPRRPRPDDILRRRGGVGNQHGPQRELAIHTQQNNNIIFESPDYSMCAWQDGRIIVEDEYTGPREPPSVKPTASGVYQTVGQMRQIISQGPQDSIVLISYDLGIIHERLEQLSWRLILSGGSIVIVGFIIGWIATGRAVRPITEINRVSQKIAKGDLGERIKIKNPTQEIAALSTALNSTFEELEQTFDHLRRFTADASHELRNPIAAMLMEVEVALAGSVEDEETRESLEVCKRNLDDMTNLVQSLLALARLDAGTLEDEREDEDLALVVEAVCDRYTDQADKLDLQLTTQIDPAPCHIVLSQMIRVLDNLLSNAFKYGADGKHIEVISGTNGQETFLKVRDHGKGIHPDHLPHLFERFYRVDESRTHKQGSTGIGLAIVEALVKVNNGTIQVESQLGEGTTFIVTLPTASRNEEGR